MSSLLVDLFTCLLDPTTSDLHPADDYVGHHCAFVPYPGTAYLKESTPHKCLHAYPRLIIAILSPIGLQSSPSRVPWHSAQPCMCSTQTIGDPVLLNRLVRFRPFLNEELWIGTDDMRIHRCGSRVRRRVAWVRAWLRNVGVTRAEATHSMGERVSYRMHWFIEWWPPSKKGF